MPPVPGRPRRSAAERRAQYQRAQFRVVQSLLRGFRSLQDHRGCRPTTLGVALGQALGSPRPSSSPAASPSLNADAPAFVPTIEFQSQVSQLASSVGHMASTLSGMFDSQRQLVVQVRSLSAEPLAPRVAPPPSIPTRDVSCGPSDSALIGTFDVGGDSGKGPGVVPPDSAVGASSGVCIGSGVVTPVSGFGTSSGVCKGSGVVPPDSAVGASVVADVCVVDAPSRTSPWFQCGVCSNRSYCSTYCHYCPDVSADALDSGSVDGDALSIHSSPF